MDGHARRCLETRGASVAVFRVSLHPEFHILGRDPEFMLQHTARPQRRRLLVLRNADPLALEVGRGLDSGIAAHQNTRVKEAAS